MSERPSMDLLTAWVVATDGGAREHRCALGRIFSELRELATKRLRHLADSDRDDVVQRAFLKLVEARRNAARADETRGEGGVRAYIRRCLDSAVADCFATSGTPSVDLEETEAASGEETDRATALMAAIARFEDELVRPLAGRRRADREEALPRAVREMIDLRLDRRTVEGIVGLPPTHPEFRSKRTALYQRHCVARRELLHEIERKRRRQLLSAADAERLGATLDWLRRRRKRKPEASR